MMIVLLVVIGVAAIAILGRKYANTALPTVLALALCCCMSLGIYFYASVFSRAGELIFAAVGGVLLSAGVYALTNSICKHRAVLKDAIARIAGPRKPLVEFVESDEEEHEKSYKNPDHAGLIAKESEKEELPKLWEEDQPESEQERRAFDEALDEALFADTEATVEAEMEAEEAAATKSNVKEQIEETAAESNEDTLQEPFAVLAVPPLVPEETLETEEAPDDAEPDQFIIEEEESEIPPLALEETLENEEASDNAEPEQFIIEEEESDIPPLVLEEIAEKYTFTDEPDFLPPFEEEDEEAFNEEVEITSEQAEVMESEADSKITTDEVDAKKGAGMVEFDAAKFVRFIEEDLEAEELKAAEAAVQEPEVNEPETDKFFAWAEKEDEAVVPETAEIKEASKQETELYDEAFTAVELEMPERTGYEEEPEADTETPGSAPVAMEGVLQPAKEAISAASKEEPEIVLIESTQEQEPSVLVSEPAKELAFEPVPALDDYKRRKDEAMAEVKSLVAKRQYSDALTSLFTLLNSGFALCEDEKRQLLIIMKLLKEKGI
ncbi:MAG TPA: hypothetical protein VN608_09390 [Clostridia bacterium]|nr:hypothetical protein [Clostridia bacterium]